MTDRHYLVARSTGGRLDEVAVMDRAALIAAAEQVAGHPDPNRTTPMILERTRLNWSGQDGAPRATVGASLEPCRHCGKQALLRHPETRRPCHKICEEDAIDRATLARFVIAALAVIGRATRR